MYRGYPWTFLFTDLSGVTTTAATGLLRNMRVVPSLNQAMEISGEVFPDRASINTVFTDGYRRIAQNIRVCYGFRDEGSGPVCRAAGIVMLIEDEGDVDVPLTHFTAYDPWKLLEARPAMSSDGLLPSQEGFLRVGPGNVIVKEFLDNTIANEGNCFIDPTPFHFETTVDVVLEVQQGMSVADVWTELTTGGALDVVLRPKYAPGSPLYTHEYGVYALAGSEKPDAIFAWDCLMKNLRKISRPHDGTPGNFFDKVLYYIGEGGFPLGNLTGGPEENAEAVADFGSYWSQNITPSQANLWPDLTGTVAYKMQKQALWMARQGTRTLSLSPITDFSPIPLLDYGLGDRVLVYAHSDADLATLRAPIDGFFRVSTIPISIPDDGIGEEVEDMTVSPDWRDGSGAGVGSSSGGGGGSTGGGGGAGGGDSGGGGSFGSGLGPSGIAIPTSGLSAPGGGTFALIFSDDFDTIVVPDGAGVASAGETGYFPQAVSGDWTAYPWPWQGTPTWANYFPERVTSIHDHVMDVHIHSETISGQTRYLITANVPKILGSSDNQLYGRYSVCYQQDNFHGYHLSYLTWPQSEVWPRDGEIDFPECDTDSSTIQAFMHQQNGTSGGDQDAYSISKPSYGRWYVATIEWTPTQCRFLLFDSTTGVETIVGDSTSRIPNTPMHWVLQHGGSFDSHALTSDAGHVLIDWVAVWSYTP